MLTLDKRLARIEERVDGSQVRAYGFVYDEAPETLRSRLTAVQSFGSDFTVGSDGKLSGGTRLPDTKFTYENGQAGFGPVDDRNHVLDDPRVNQQIADFDGDGRLDRVVIPTLAKNCH